MPKPKSDDRNESGPVMTTEQSWTLNDAMVGAIQKTMAEIPYLAKEDRNAFAKYNYVSIDDYYDRVAQVAMKNGLSWVISEEECVITPDGGTACFRYTFDLFHRGEGGTTYSLGLSQFSVPHPMQGAQTSGSAASYAEKLFMRTLFKVRTGEADADATPALQAPKAGPKPAPVVKLVPSTVPPAMKEALQAAKPAILEDVAQSITKEVDGVYAINPDLVRSDPNGVDILVTAFRLFTPMARSKDELVKFKGQNEAAIQYLKGQSPAYYREVRDLFISTASRLESENAQ